MKVALTAPCSFGHRPVEFVVVQDQDRIRELASCKSYGGSQIIGAGAVVVVMVNLDRGEFRMAMQFLILWHSVVKLKVREGIRKKILIGVKYIMSCFNSRRLAC